MGYTQAQEFATLVEEGQVSLENALAWHLQANHYPPVPTSLIPACIEAIEAGNAEDWGRLIALPNGIAWKGQNAAPASEIIEAHHLHSFLEV